MNTLELECSEGVMRNRMRASSRNMSYEQCMEVEMTPAQREVFLIVDEWWKKYGCSSALRQIADVCGKSGIGF